MLRLCLICESTAILTKATAQGITLLLSLSDSALQQAQKGHEDAQALGSHPLINGLAAIPPPALPSALRVAEDVAKYYLGAFNCLCLRCGVRFDDPEP